MIIDTVLVYFLGQGAMDSILDNGAIDIPTKKNKKFGNKHRLYVFIACTK